MKWKKTHRSRSNSRKSKDIGKFRSKLEQKVSLLLGADWKYEPRVIDYVMHRKYKPDFCKDNLIVEVKGFFRPGDQAKYLSVRENLEEGEELIFIFSNSDKPVRKGAKSTMGDWCDKHGFRYYNTRNCGRLR